MLQGHLKLQLFAQPNIYTSRIQGPHSYEVASNLNLCFGNLSDILQLINSMMHEQAARRFLISA